MPVPSPHVSSTSPQVISPSPTSPHDYIPFPAKCFQLQEIKNLIVRRIKLGLCISKFSLLTVFAWEMGLIQPALFSLFRLSAVSHIRCEQDFNPEPLGVSLNWLHIRVGVFGARVIISNTKCYFRNIQFQSSSL